MYIQTNLYRHTVYRPRPRLTAAPPPHTLGIVICMYIHNYICMYTHKCGSCAIMVLLIDIYSHIYTYMHTYMYMHVYIYKYVYIYI